MLEALGEAIILTIEKELVKHAPEIQEALIAQLDKLATLLFDYVQNNLLQKCEESSDQTKLLPKDE